MSQPDAYDLFRDRRKAFRAECEFVTKDGMTTITHTPTQTRVEVTRGFEHVGIDQLMHQVERLPATIQ